MWHAFQHPSPTSHCIRLKGRAAVDASSADGSTALHIAPEGGHTAVVQQMLLAGPAHADIALACLPGFLGWLLVADPGLGLQFLYECH